MVTFESDAQSSFHCPLTFTRGEPHVYVFYFPYSLIIYDFWTKFKFWSCTAVWIEQPNYVKIFLKNKFQLITKHSLKFVEFKEFYKIIQNSSKHSMAWKCLNPTNVIISRKQWIFWPLTKSCRNQILRFHTTNTFLC